MNSGYFVFLASQPVGQVLLQKADSVISFLQPFLEKLQPTGCEVGDTATAESELEPEVGLPASHTSELLKKASGISSWLVSTVVHPTSRVMVSFFKEGKNAVEDLKSRGVQLMEEKSEKESAPQALVIRVFWKPVECVWRYINKISQPYVFSEAKANEENKLVKMEDASSLTQQPTSAQSILDDPESLDLVREDQQCAGDEESREVEPAAGPETTAATSLEDTSSVAEPETCDTTVPVQSDLEHQQPHSRDSRTDSKLKAFFKFGKKLYN